MNGYFSRLNPSERRFVVGVLLLFFIIINLFFVWPHFSDWGKLQKRLRAARVKLADYTAVMQQAERLKPDLARMEREGASVPAEDQAGEFMRTINIQAQQTGMHITSYGHQTLQTNQFFNEQTQTISGIAGEKELVDFLYQLGSGNSLVRVSAISVRPDPPRQRLNANVTLVASYQKNPKPAASAAAAPDKGSRPQPAAASRAPSARPNRPPAPNQPSSRPNRPPTPNRPPAPKPATPTKK